jgi:hypothetical protein
MLMAVRGEDCSVSVTFLERVIAMGRTNYGVTLFEFADFCELRSFATWNFDFGLVKAVELEGWWRWCCDGNGGG